MTLHTPHLDCRSDFRMVSRYRGWLEQQQRVIEDIAWLKVDATVSLMTSGLLASMDSYEALAAEEAAYRQNIAVHRALIKNNAWLLVLSAMTSSIVAVVFVYTDFKEIMLLVLLGTLFPALGILANLLFQACAKRQASLKCLNIQHTLQNSKLDIKCDISDFCALLQRCARSSASDGRHAIQQWATTKSQTQFASSIHKPATTLLFETSGVASCYLSMNFPVSPSAPPGGI